MNKSDMIYAWLRPDGLPVYSASLGFVHTRRREGDRFSYRSARGQWMALHKEHEGTRALLTGDTGFPRIPTLEGNAAKGSYYPLIFPSTMFGSTVDCMWWRELQPLSASRTRLIVGSCFPKAVTERADFEEVVERYYKRWDISVPEDNDISALQQIGLSSPLSKPGRLSHAEPLVHVFNNWVLDRVIGAQPAPR